MSTLISDDELRRVRLYDRIHLMNGHERQFLQKTSIVASDGLESIHAIEQGSGRHGASKGPL